MDDTNHLNEQHKPELEKCLKQLAEVLKVIGVEELTIENDFQYHLINEEQQVPKYLIQKFCGHVTEMYHEMVLI